MFVHAGSSRSALIRAALAVVAVALASSACASAAATAVPSPTAAATTPTAMAPALATASAAVAGATLDPAALPGRYQSGADASQLVDLLPDGNAYLEANFAATHDAYSVSADQITFAGESCTGTKGTYRWSLQQDALTLTVVDDACATRVAMLAAAQVGPLRRLAQQFPYATMQVSKAFEQPDYNGSTVDAAGNFYESDGASGVYEYHRDGSLIRSWTAGLSYTIGITVDAHGNVYVANFDDATIHKFSATGKPIMSWKVGGGEAGPSGLAHDLAGNIYVALHRTHDHYVEKYSPTGKLIAAWATTGTGDGQIGATSHTGPGEIAVDGAGNTYVGDPDNNRIVKFDPNGKYLLNVTGDGTRKIDGGQVTVDSKGNVYAESNAAIWKFDASGKFLGEWFCPYPVDLVVDAHDNLFGVDREIIALSLPTT